MPNIMSVLKSEISRLARKEAKAVVSPVQKASAAYRRLIASLRKQVASLQKEVAGLKKAVPAPEKTLTAKTEPEGRFWITGQGVKTLRKRLGLTLAVFGKLAGVSGQTVINWEGSEGKIDIRKKATMARLQEIKGKGKKEVAEILGAEMAPEKVKAPKAPKVFKKAKAPKKSKAPKTPKASQVEEKIEEKPVETPAKSKKD